MSVGPSVHGLDVKGNDGKLPVFNAQQIPVTSNNFVFLFLEELVFWKQI